MTKEMDKNTGGEWTHQSHDVTGAMVPEMPATYAERKPIWIVMRRTGMSYRQIGEVSGVSYETVRQWVNDPTVNNLTVGNDLPTTVIGKDGKERAATKPKTQILDSYLRCYTQEEIAEKEGMTQQAIDDLLQNGNSAELQQSPMALHQVDFEIPLYNYALSSTTVKLTADSLTDGVILPGRSLHTSLAFKSVNFEIATRYNRFLGGLTLRVGQLFPVSEAPA
jgi:transcriptional regulator with XRE-family HTH domain